MENSGMIRVETPKRDSNGERPTYYPFNMPFLDGVFEEYKEKKAFVDKAYNSTI